MAALVKQIPGFEEMRLDIDGRLLRDGVGLEMSAYCRRAVAKAVELVAEHGGSCTIMTLGVATAAFTERNVPAASLLVVLRRDRDDDIDVLAEANTVIGIGGGVPRSEQELLYPLCKVLGAGFAATRKITDQGWLPRARQIGNTGRSIEPRLYIAVGISGKFDYTIGVLRSGTVVASNNDPAAPMFTYADIGLVGDWREIAPPLTASLTDSPASASAR